MLQYCHDCLFKSAEAFAIDRGMCIPYIHSQILTLLPIVFISYVSIVSMDLKSQICELIVHITCLQAGVHITLVVYT